MSQGTIAWDKSKAKVLAKAHSEAVKAGKDQFTLMLGGKSYEFVTSYAGYLLEYLQGRGL